VPFWVSLLRGSRRAHFSGPLRALPLASVAGTRFSNGTVGTLQQVLRLIEQHGSESAPKVFKSGSTRPAHARVSLGAA
jgi:hypothetical protein